MVKFNAVGQCPESYEENGFCLSYFFKEFNEYPTSLSIKEDYLKHIKRFHDPILIYVSLYLYHNYRIAHKYFKTKSGDKQQVDSYNNDACAVLNRWLDQQKNFYTNFGTCNYNTRWWYISIEPLWEMLESYFNGNTCKRNHSNNLEATIVNYNSEERKGYQLMPEDYVCYDEKNNTKSDEGNEVNQSIKENCAKLSVLFYLGETYSILDEKSNESSTTANNYCNGKFLNEKINYNPVLKAEKSYVCQSLINKIAVPISVTILGTIFLVFFLNEFTPIGSIFGNSSKNKVRLREQFNEEAEYKEYKTYKNNNKNRAREKNIIYYQSMNR